MADVMQKEDNKGRVHINLKANGPPNFSSRTEGVLEIQEDNTFGRQIGPFVLA